MSRSLHTKWTPASLGDSIDKTADCAQCRKEPVKGKSFMVCSGCKQVSFCSKECQTAAWKGHREYCKKRQAQMKAMANQPSSPDFPIYQIRRRLLSDFVEVHQCDFESAFYSAVIMGGGSMEKFPFDTRAVRVYLKYNPACSENPSTAFRLVAWEFFDDASSRAHPMPRASSTETYYEEQMRAQPGFCGVLCVHFRMEDANLFESYPQLRKTGIDPVIRAALEKIKTEGQDHKTWFERMQKLVEDGLVKRAFSEQDQALKMGRIELKKGKWVWVELEEAELKSRGLQSVTLF
ncbi:MYND-type domain-containing protein [Mycena chlorophos]|uniref:MYND-type domain-containing protein n=1 Tax=Mycena chlorophos TaxID=658473 RepID=A0A8H6TEP1_MYCCL|nr:MYND-type domain-containing protein [Mycena chlorophos]